MLEPRHPPLRHTILAGEGNQGIVLLDFICERKYRLLWAPTASARPGSGGCSLASSPMCSSSEQRCDRSTGREEIGTGDAGLDQVSLRCVFKLLIQAVASLGGLELFLPHLPALD